MGKRVLDIGNCNADHRSIRGLLETHFAATVDRAHTADEALAALRAGRYDLVLVNRILDRDGTEGVDVIRRMKADPAVCGLPVMLISNYADAQDAAVAAGALRGFGKADLRNDDVVVARLSPLLEP